MSVAFLKIWVLSRLVLAETFHWQADSEFRRRVSPCKLYFSFLIVCNLHSVLARRFFLLRCDAVNSDTNVMILREFSCPLHHIRSSNLTLEAAEFFHISMNLYRHSGCHISKTSSFIVFKATCFESHRHHPEALLDFLFSSRLHLRRFIDGHGLCLLSHLSHVSCLI